MAPPQKKTNQILLEAHALCTRPSSETLGSTQTAGVDTWKAAKAEELLSQMMVLTVRPNEFSSLDIYLQCRQVAANCFEIM